MNRSGLPRNKVLVGDVRQLLPRLPASSVDCIITSPPYFGLRDYGHPAQLGLERDIDGWVASLRAVCRGLARVLKPTGAVWLNVGDGYSAHAREGAAPKSLLLGPQRLAIALASDGWLIRNQIIWAKTNAMPNSTRDRLTNRHELLYFLVRAKHYHFDLDAIRILAATAVTRPQHPRAPEYPPPDAAPRSVDRNQGLSQLKRLGVSAHPLGRNPGDVWETATASYRGAHFATFPERLITPALLATCPARVCSVCGGPWQRGIQHRHGRLLAVGPLRPACACHATWQPGIVLDPFMGAGTVALGAAKHQRDWIGIELNPVYAALTERRLADWRAHQDHEHADEVAA
jgi:site-specific DNA-methyltransferase (adenine-specific)